MLACDARFGFPPCCSCVQRARLAQLVLHPRHALARGFFRSASAPPMGFETHSVLVAILLQSTELACPINDAFAHGSPFEALATRFALRILAVHVPDPVLWQQL